jgi:hypothetical protein
MVQLAKRVTAATELHHQSLVLLLLMLAAVAAVRMGQPHLAEQAQLGVTVGMVAVAVALS